VSYHDANQLEALAPSAGGRIRVVPSAIDLRAYPFRQVGAQHALLFLGRLDYRPNVESLRWLVTEVLPRLFAWQPRARLFIVGAHPPAWLIAAGQRDDRIAVIGHVEDERPYLQRASALLLPLEVAAGSRLKALVAMASGVPIVATRLGMEGLEAVADEQYVLARDLRAETWAKLLANVLQDHDRRASLARKARQLVEACYDWPAVAPLVRAAYAV
jgi:glycosyltransferase involved in cell wall biosynthesis